MPKLRHIALAAEDPFAAAEFYKQAFDFTEVSRIEKSDDRKSPTACSSATAPLSLAVLHFGWDQGPGLDFRGVHHFGVLVEDVDAVASKIEKLGAKCFAKRPEGHKGLLRNQVLWPGQGGATASTSGRSLSRARYWPASCGRHAGKSLPRQLVFALQSLRCAVDPRLQCGGSGVARIHLGAPSSMARIHRDAQLRLTQ